MAISLPNYIDPATQLPLTYFHINSNLSDFNNAQLTIGISGYASQVAYAGGATPFQPPFLLPNTIPSSIVVPPTTYAAFLQQETQADIPAGTPFTTMLQLIQGALYQYLLTLPMFSGGTIVS